MLKSIKAQKGDSMNSYQIKNVVTRHGKVYEYTREKHIFRLAPKSSSEGLVMGQHRASKSYGNRWYIYQDDVQIGMIKADMCTVKNLAEFLAMLDETFEKENIQFIRHLKGV